MQVRGSAAALLLLGVISVVESRAQAPNNQGTPLSAPSPNAPEMSSHDAPATFTTKVNLVMVPVVVRDSKGKAVGTLTKEDFQLFDKGKPQIISRFTVEKAGDNVIPAEVATADPDFSNGARAPATVNPTAIAQRFVIYLFDDVNTETTDLIQARNAADRHLAESMDATTRAAIFTTSGLNNVDFTDDRAQLHDSLMKLMSRRTIGPRGTQCPDLSYYMADLIANKNDQTALQAAVSEAMASCTPPASNTPAAIQQAQQTATSLSQGMARQIVDLGERDTRLALTVLVSSIRRLAAVPGDRSLILASAGFLIPDDLRFEESDLMDRAIRANVRISSLNARGLYALVPGGDASTATSAGGPSVLTAKTQYDQQSAIAEEGVLEELADATGGRFFHNNNDLKAGFNQIAAAPEFVYLLGFSPQNLKLDGAYHALKVKLITARGLDLQARRGYYAPKHLADPEEDAKREIEEALFSRDELQDIPLELHMQFFKSSDVAANIAVLAHLNLKNLRFRKADGRNNDNLTVLSGLFDRNGNLISGIQKTVVLHLLDSTLDKLINSGLTVKTNFDAAPGSYVVRLVVRDSEGQTMAARNGVVDIP
jgi:VWFA-related protein